MDQITWSNLLHTLLLTDLEDMFTIRKIWGCELSISSLTTICLLTFIYFAFESHSFVSSPGEGLWGFLWEYVRLVCESRCRWCLIWKLNKRLTFPLVLFRIKQWYSCLWHSYSQTVLRFIVWLIDSATSVHKNTSLVTCGDSIHTRLSNIPYFVSSSYIQFMFSIV